MTDTIILFPVSKRIGKVRHTAELLAAKQGDEASLYWKQVCAGMRKHFERVGIPEAEAENELRAFFDAVQNELCQMDDGKCKPGGAA